MRTSPKEKEQDARDLLILALLVGLPLFGLRGIVRPPGLGPPAPERACRVPVEVREVGVGCLSDELAQAAGLLAGDRIAERAAFPAGVDRGRMAPERLAAWDAPVDLNRASASELASLDGVGPHLAARIVAARPFRAVEELERVRGIGRRRLRALLPRLRLRESP